MTLCEPCDGDTYLQIFGTKSQAGSGRTWLESVACKVPQQAPALPFAINNVGEKLEGFMRTANEYYRHAEECIRLAKVSSNQDTRRLLFEMAKAWEAFVLARSEAPSARPLRILDLEAIAIH